MLVSAPPTSDKQTKDLSEKANGALLSKLAAAGVTYGFAIFLARVLPAVDFGQIAFFLNAAFLLSVVGAVGQQMVLVRFIPALKSRSDVPAISYSVRLAFRLAATGSTITYLCATVAALSAKKFGFLPDYSITAILIGFALVVLVGWSDLQSHLARGFGRIQLSLLPKEVFWRAIAATLLALLLWAWSPATVGAEFVLAILMSTLVVLNLAQGRMLGVLPLLRAKDAPRGQSSHGTARPFWITSVSNIFLANADVVYVGFLLGPKAAGFYFAANRLSMLLAFFMTSYNIVLGPAVSLAWSQSNIGQVHALVHRTTLKSAAPTLGLGIILFFLAPQFLAVFGPGFSNSAAILQVLIIAGALNAASGPADIVLNMCGFEKPAMRISAMSLIFSAVVLPAGAMTGGGLGVAVAVLIATVLRKFLFWRAATIHMSLRSDIFAAMTSASIKADGVQS